MVRTAIIISPKARKIKGTNFCFHICKHFLLRYVADFRLNIVKNMYVCIYKKFVVRIILNGLFNLNTIYTTTT